MDLTKKFEKIPVNIFRESQDAAAQVAEKVISSINNNNKLGRKTVLALAASSTCIPVYEMFVEAYNKKKVSFSKTVVFSLDEYYPLGKDELQSHYRFLKEYLFDYIDIKPENICCLDSNRHDNPHEYCASYEAKIASEGGIDFLITSGMANNETGSNESTRTRVVTLNYTSKMIAAGDFFGVDFVPDQTITVGISTILDAKQIFFLAAGEGSASKIQKIAEGPVTDQIPASYLQLHNNVELYIDDAASVELTRITTPWLVGDCKWTPYLIKKACFWLCRKLDKPILKLTNRDYNDNGLGRLIAEYGPGSKINIEVFNNLQHTISGWPGGKPGVDDSTRPERALPYPKRVVVFSPHPDDDVISMGGTVARLSSQGHEVHLCYQTSGNIAVFDHEVIKFIDVLRELDVPADSDLHLPQINNVFQRFSQSVAQKRPGQPDSAEVRAFKAAIRRGEAKDACRFLGIPDERVHFLNLPFYETGGVKKKPLSQADIDIVKAILQDVQPHQVFAAGDLSDPHGTHRVCLMAIIKALHQLKDEPWMKDCRVWMYRGAWQEWDVADEEMAVPLSPEEVKIKREAIFRHQSQKDVPLFPGADKREFWLRAEERNHNTAVIFDKLGMAEYQAIELFVQYHVK